MKITTRKQLLEAYNDPILFVSDKKRKMLFRNYLLIALALVAISTTIWVGLLLGDGNDSPGGYQNVNTGYTVGIIAIFLPMYSIYRLVTIKQSITKHIKNKLVEKKLPIDLG